ncbi:MAG: glycosyltransferase family 9 protein [Anaerolineae bacterium]|nr:glycosyltransferase family 9 protein [Anaerolineae bacterium]NUQ02281.1 glycosyltransferase family 9 protein [Anaerolineae bacterium]
MDKETLAHRNLRMAEAFHTPSLMEQIRSTGLRAVARLPIPPPPRGGASPDERILVIRPDHLGDVLLTLPALRRLRAIYPSAEIHALLGPWSADTLAPIKEIDLILTLPFPGFTRAEGGSLAAPYLLAAQTAQRLRRIGYNRAYVLRRDHWWAALVAFLAGVPQRIGYDFGDTGRFLTDALPYQPMHAVAANLRLVDADQSHLPKVALNYPVDEASRLAVRDLLRHSGADLNAPYTVIHVGSGAAIKNWNPEKWARTADALRGDLEGSIILTGSLHESALAEQIAARMKISPVNLTGATDLPRLAALLADARLVMGSDSGPLHLAAAVGAPTVTLFGAADPDEFRPWGVPASHRIVVSTIACRPCRVLDWSGDDFANHPCVHDISVADVLENARRVLAATAYGDSTNRE